MWWHHLAPVVTSEIKCALCLQVVDRRTKTSGREATAVFLIHHLAWGDPPDSNLLYDSSMTTLSHSWSPSPCPAHTFTLEAQVGGPKRPLPPPFPLRASVCVYGFTEKMKENFAPGLGKENREKNKQTVRSNYRSGFQVNLCVMSTNK